MATTVWADTTSIVNQQFDVDVYFSKSQDGGDSWDPPRVINGGGPDNGDQFFPWIEVDPGGGLNVVFLDSRHTPQLDSDAQAFLDAYYARSEDGGETWVEHRLTPAPWSSADDGLLRPFQFIGDYLGMAVGPEHVWPIYPDTSNGNADVYTNRVDLCTEPLETEKLVAKKSPDGATLTFLWQAALYADDYLLYQDASPDGAFGIIVGTAPDGDTGVTLPVTTASRYYLVAGRNDCGIGPR